MLQLQAKRQNFRKLFHEKGDLPMMYYDFTPIFFHRQEVLRWNGWGYKDSGFIIDDKHVTFQGKRYMAYIGHK